MPSHDHRQKPDAASSIGHTFHTLHVMCDRHWQSKLFTLDLLHPRMWPVQSADNNSKQRGLTPYFLQEAQATAPLANGHSPPAAASAASRFMSKSATFGGAHMLGDSAAISATSSYAELQHEVQRRSKRNMGTLM